MATRNDIAFVVGLDHYRDSPLSSCEADATEMARLLGNNDDEQQTRNFTVKPLIPERSEAMPGRVGFLDTFASILPGIDQHDFLFYFSGHGATHDWGSEIILNAADGLTERVSMEEILTLINQSEVRQAVVVLDCCFAGTFGTASVLAPGGTGRRGFIKAPAVVRPNLMILAAASAGQAAFGGHPYSAFTELLIAGLQGGAADHKGEVSSLSLFGYAAPAFGPLDQRPNFKANMSSELVLRTCAPRVKLDVLRRLTDHFTTAGELDLTPEDVAERDEPRLVPADHRYEDLLILREAGYLACPDFRPLKELADARETIRLSAAGRQAFLLAARDKI